MPLVVKLNPQTGQLEFAEASVELDPTGLLSASSGVSMPTRGGGGLVSSLITDAAAANTQRRLASLGQGESVNGVTLSEALADRGKFMDAVLGGFFGRALDLLLARGAGHRLAQQFYQDLLGKAAEAEMSRIPISSALALRAIGKESVLDPEALRFIPGLTKEVRIETPVTKNEATGDIVPPPPVTLGFPGETLQEVIGRAIVANAIPQPGEGPKQFLGRIGASLVDVPGGTKGRPFDFIALDEEEAKANPASRIPPDTQIVAPAQGQPALERRPVTEIQREKQIVLVPEAMLPPELSKAVLAAATQNLLPLGARTQVALGELQARLQQALASELETKFKVAAAEAIKEAAIKAGLPPEQATILALKGPEAAGFVPGSPQARKTEAEIAHLQQQMAHENVRFPFAVAKLAEELKFSDEKEKLLQRRIDLMQQQLAASKDETERAKAGLRVHTLETALRTMQSVRSGALPIDAAVDIINQTFKEAGLPLTVSGEEGFFGKLREVGKTKLGVQKTPPASKAETPSDQSLDDARKELDRLRKEQGKLGRP